MSGLTGNIGRIAQRVSPEVAQALAWVAALRLHDGFGYSPNEQKLMALADEVTRLRNLMKLSQRAKR